MESIVAIIISILFVAPVARASSAGCKDPNFRKYLQMGYKEFDQSPPDGGWRALQGKGKELMVAKLLDGYLTCRSGLTGEQKATLVFHSGQIYGDLGRTELAVERMKNAYNDSLDKKYHWNSFVDGSIAFLTGDLGKLKAARDKVRAAEPDHPYVETLDDLIRCFKRPYNDFDRCRNEKQAQPTSPQSAVR